MSPPMQRKGVGRLQDPDPTGLLVCLKEFCRCKINILCKLKCCSHLERSHPMGNWCCLHKTLNGIATRNRREGKCSGVLSILAHSLLFRSRMNNTVHSTPVKNQRILRRDPQNHLSFSQVLPRSFPPLLFPFSPA